MGSRAKFGQAIYERANSKNSAGHEANREYNRKYHGEWGIPASSALSPLSSGAELLVDPKEAAGLAGPEAGIKAVVAKQHSVAAVSRLSPVGVVDQSKTGIPTHRYHFPQQDTELRGGENLKSAGGDQIGTCVAINTDDRSIDIKKSRATADIDPAAIFAHQIFDTKEQADALFRIGEYVAEHGLEGEGDYQAARALLLRQAPRIGGKPIRKSEETSLEAAIRVAGSLEGGIFPIQGPPALGKPIPARA